MSIGTGIESAQIRSVCIRYCGCLWFTLLLTSTLLVSPGHLLADERPATCASWPPFLSFLDWFDRFFFFYNLLLLLFVVLVIPGITYFYIKNMKVEKHRRIKNDLTEVQWNSSGPIIKKMLDYQFSMQNYWGSVLSLMIVTMFGASILLLLKPVSNLTLGPGVDYSRGANILLLGPYIESFKVHDQELYHHIIVSLTAFQFGFLGAYIYMIGDLVRDYFTLDLTPHTFVASTIRVVTASLLALVMSFIFGHLSVQLTSITPVVSFFFGYFPETALVYITQWMTSKFHLQIEQYRATPLTDLPGMGYANMSRLIREGYDNVENLANAMPLELVLRTGFSYSQARQWVSQAWLRSHLGDDYFTFLKSTGITSAAELVDYLEKPNPAVAADPDESLNTVTESKLHDKLQIVCKLARLWKPEVDRWVFRE